MKDAYETLGLSSTSTNPSPRAYSDDEIKKAYLELAKKWHPDVNPSPEAKSMFQRISQAYELVKDETSRLRYQQLIAYRSSVAYSYSNHPFDQETPEDSYSRYNKQRAFYTNVRRVGNMAVLFLLPIIGVSTVLWLVTRNNGKNRLISTSREQQVEAWFNPT